MTENITPTFDPTTFDPAHSNQPYHQYVLPNGINLFFYLKDQSGDLHDLNNQVFVTQEEVLAYSAWLDAQPKPETPAE
jgi:hypothetical protein